MRIKRGIEAIILFLLILNIYFVCATNTFDLFSPPDIFESKTCQQTSTIRPDGKSNLDIIFDPHTNLRINGINNPNINAKLGHISSSKFKTQIIAVETEKMENAVITLPKSGDVDSILYCPDFDMNSFNCKKWEETNIPIAQTKDSITFTVTHFTAYAGGGGSNSSGIKITGSSLSSIKNNKINSTAADSYGIHLWGQSGNHLFLNNNITVNNNYAIFDNSSTSSYSSQFIYNNSYGQIRWVSSPFLDNLTLKGDIGLGTNLFIGNNIAALNTSRFATNFINSSAEITLRGLTYEDVTQVIKDPEYETNTGDVNGPNCLGTGSGCQITSYSGGILIFTTDSFSSFKADDG